MNTGVIDPATSKAQSRGKPSAAKSWLKAIELTSRIEADPGRLFADVVEDWAKREPDRPALISETETLSYRMLADRTNRYARWAPPSECENRHRLRLACGNGLRGDIWEAFQARFAVPKILEFYAATEGNFSLYNVEGKVGAIGRIPPLLAHRFPATIVRVDMEAGALLRTADGLCVPCARGEVGEAVGRIGTADNGGGRFEGYTDKSETEKKILRNVLAQGDAWFRTGDLMRLDEAGYFHFVDRVGDTFRWKGENVATSEVNEAVVDCLGVVDTTTYGVEIPGTDGRAGMAAIVIDDDFDFKEFQNHLSRRLPAYAQPVFVRICAALDTTETFKQKKHQLVREGFDPNRVKDPLFFRDPKSGAYRPIDATDHARILDGSIRL
jgi:fatty-acyl-CoA synthase